MYNVLIFPAGEANSAELHLALKNQVNVTLFGASSVERLGHHMFDRYRNDLPLVTEPQFIDRLNELIELWNIDLIIPTHDSVVTFFAKNAKKINAKTTTSDTEAAELCRDKELTYRLFSKYDFVPKIYIKSDLLEFPIFVKPKVGQGSVGARILQNASDASSIDWEIDIVCEFLPGKELTVDCFTDKNGRLLCASSRTRDRTVAGISSAGRALREIDDVRRIAEIINSKMSFVGMWFFQVKEDLAGKYKLLEISARCAGSQCLTRATGVNLPLLTVYAAMGREVSVRPNNYEIRMDRTFSSRYDHNIIFQHVYIDFDDTITHRGNVNTDIMRLIYQWRNEGKEIYLITRHPHNIKETLSALAISENLFNEIIHISNSQSKADFIKSSEAIFIDNSFIEREDVSLKTGVPVFDVDTTEIFHSWRG